MDFAAGFPHLFCPCPVSLISAEHTFAKPSKLAAKFSLITVPKDRILMEYLGGDVAGFVGRKRLQRPEFLSALSFREQLAGTCANAAGTAGPTGRRQRQG